MIDIIHIHDFETENQVLGECMRIGRLANIRDILTADDFFSTQNAIIYTAICKVVDKGDVPDMNEVLRECERIDKEHLVTANMVADIAFNECLNLRSAALELKELSERRRLTDMCVGILSDCMRRDTDLDTIRERAMCEMKQSETQARFMELKQLLPQVYDNISENMKMNGKNNRRTGFSFIDNKSGGLHRGSLIVIGGASSQGKTSFATAIVTNACKEGAKIGVFSMEMTPMQLTARMVATKSGVSNSRILYMPLQEDEVGKTDKAMGELGMMQGSIYFDGRANSNIDTIIASIRMMCAKYDIEGAVIDYLQILNVNMKSANKEQQMADVARRLKNLAIELDIWIICLSQLNRDKEHPEPSIDRLRDSGQIAEAADDVMLIYRPETEGREYSGEFQKYSAQGTAEIKIVKGRNIGIGHFLCGFRANTTEFYDLQGQYPANTGTGVKTKNDKDKLPF